MNTKLRGMHDTWQREGEGEVRNLIAGHLVDFTELL